MSGGPADPCLRLSLRRAKTAFVYETLAQRVLSPAKVAALRDAVLGMDTLPDAREILVLLS